MLNSGLQHPLLITCLVLLIAGCGGGGSSSSKSTTAEFKLSIPEGFPEPVIPQDNALTAEKIELGRHLFYERRMSINVEKSCGDCHEQRKAFTDGLKTSVGISAEEIHPRNAMSLTNALYNATFTWANPNTLSLENQAQGVLFNESPVELGWSDAEDVILDRFRQDSLYQELFSAAFPGESDPFNVDNVTKAVASFQRTLISADSPYDKDIRGDTGTMSEAAKRGRELFFGERLECFHCHGGFNFSQAVKHGGLAFEQSEFHNNGLYNIDGVGGYPLNSTGLWEFTLEASDMGKFRAPTLRNITLTAPYMHDGSIATLESVLVDHYSRGGRLIEDADNAGDGATNPFKSSLLLGFSLSDSELTDILAFFDSLTDQNFICNEEFSDPFGNIPHHTDCP